MEVLRRLFACMCTYCGIVDQFHCKCVSKGIVFKFVRLKTAPLVSDWGLGESQIQEAGSF